MPTSSRLSAAERGRCLSWTRATWRWKFHRGLYQLSDLPIATAVLNQIIVRIERYRQSSFAVARSGITALAAAMAAFSVVRSSLASRSLRASAAASRDWRCASLAARLRRARSHGSSAPHSYIGVRCNPPGVKSNRVAAFARPPRNGASPSSQIRDPTCVLGYLCAYSLPWAGSRFIDSIAGLPITCPI